jgi:hypothetical protein
LQTGLQEYSSDKRKPGKFPERGKKWKRSRIKICCCTTLTTGGFAFVVLLKGRVSNRTAVKPGSETFGNPIGLPKCVNV